MAEPTSSTGFGLLGLFIILFGPLAGPYAYILFGATLGAATALGKAEVMGVWIGLWYLVRIIFTALLFTLPLAMGLAELTRLPIEILMGCVAYLIGWQWDFIVTNSLRALFKWLPAQRSDGKGKGEGK